MAKPGKKKIFGLIVFTIISIIAGIAISFYVMLVMSVPQTDGEITLDGINEQVEILYDAKGIPQIYASNETDAYFALGYQHAADRMFQMDLSRRVAQGKLSELLGSVTESIDIEQIKIGHYRLAKEAEKKLSDKNRIRLQAYTDGVNQYSQTCKSLPFEYRFLPVDFVKWTLTDCLSLLSFQTWYSNSLMNRDALYNKLADKIGKEKAQTLLFRYPEFAPVTVDNNKIQSKTLDIAPNISSSYNFVYQLDLKHQSSFVQEQIANQFFHHGISSFQMSQASNAWVVAPSRSESGKAILASDPHLELGRLPQFWYATGIHIKDSQIDAFGITTPGLPFFVMGHNKISAWAFTAGGNDVVDYKEIMLSENDSLYLSETGWKEFTVVSTKHKNSSLDSSTTVETKLCDYGVVMQENDSTAVVLNWVGYDVDLDIGVTNAFNLVNTKSFEQFRKIVSNFGALDANYMYADSIGNIGYQLSTPVVKHESKSVEILQPALYSQANFEYLPLDETPHVLNPSIGWIANCNNKPDNSNSSRGFYFANRIMRIHELLNSKLKFTLDDMKKFQFDRTDSYMKHFAIEFSRILTFIGEEEKSKAMSVWDGKSDIDSYNAALAVVYLAVLKKEVFEDELDEYYESIPSKWIENFNQVIDAGWFDNINTVETETYLEVTQTAMRKAVAIVADKRWGDLQTLTMKHPLSIIPIIGSALDLKTQPIPHGGTPGTLNSSFSRKISDSSYTAIAGASMRFLVDFSDLDATTIVLPAGNSGNPMSEHFMDFYDLWRNNERWTVPISDEKIRDGAISKLTISPIK